MASTGETWRLGRRPALDGLRGVAIALVLACHSGVPHMHPGGPLGVAAFFTLSGFLITALLLEEHAAHGRISLARFYGRRARRVLPALAALLVVVVPLGVVLGGWFLNLRSLFAVVGYYANWLAVANPDLGAVGAMWSLSIEEQFYLLWPACLVFCVARWGTRGVAVAASVGVIASTSELGYLAASGASDMRLYYATDVRASGLLAGAVVAVWLHRGGRRLPTRVGSVALAALVVSALMPTALEWVGAQIVATLTVCALLVSGALDRHALLEWSPLRWLGRRSYAVYLWHWPVNLLAWRLPWAHGWLGQAVVVTAVSLVLAEVSWWCVEEPARRWRRRPHQAAVTTIRPAPLPPPRYSVYVPPVAETFHAHR